MTTATVTITNSGGTTLTGYPVKVAVTAQTGMNAGFDNIHFKDGTTELPYWRESVVTSTSAVFWVKWTVPAGGGSFTMEWTPSIVDASNGDNVFSLYDNFDAPLVVQANNAATAQVVNANYTAENIVFDSVTNKYWWIFQDSSTSPISIRMASSDSITSPVWTVETNPVISTGTDSGNSPHIVKFGSTWYIYYGVNDGAKGIYCQSSSTVNSGYSATGITNPIVAKGAAGSWEANRVLEPYVFLVGSTYYMFYMGEDAANGIEKVGYATASDPKGPWTKYGSNPVLVGDTGWWDTGNDKAADPWVIEKDGTYYIGVTGCVTGKSNWMTGVFTTTDFVTFTPCANNPVLPRGEAGTIDATSAFRGAVSLFGGVYYFAYCAQGTNGGLALTPLNFNTVGLNFAKWHERLSVDQGTGVVVLNNANDYLESTSTFGQGYALRSRSKFAAATNTGYIGFRDKSDAASDYLEMIANYPSTNTKGYQNVTGDSGTANLGTCGAYHIYEIQRNANTNGRYAIDDGTAAEVTTQLPAGALPITLAQVIETDWLVVRKYASPEPSSSVGAPTSSTDDLTATGVTTGAVTFGTPALTQSHALTATAITTGAPVLSASNIGQVHALTAAAIVTGAPVIGAPVLAIEGELIALNLTTGAPVLGAPALAQVHTLAVVAWATGVPVLGTPALFMGQIVTPVTRVFTIGGESRIFIVPAENRVVVIKE